MHISPLLHIVSCLTVMKLSLSHTRIPCLHTDAQVSLQCFKTSKPCQPGFKVMFNSGSYCYFQDTMIDFHFHSEVIICQAKIN